MKKILIVNNNMKVGGVQKSLCNLLWAMEGKYDVTLVLFRKTGAYINELPPWVKVIETNSLFRYMAISQAECVGLEDKILRGGLVGISRFFGRDSIMPMVACSQKKLPQEYDCAIAFLHNGRKESFYGGTQEFVLNCVNAKRKVAFLHCDYGECGANYGANNRILEKFDLIAACSDGCRKAFLNILPHFASKSVTVKNCHRFDRIAELAEIDTVDYGEGLHVLMVSRVAPEKGIDRAMKAVAFCYEHGKDVKLHVVGGGAKEADIRALTKEYGVENNVFFHGEQENPYRYMKKAHLLLIASYHEAAPMVIDEAVSLNVPVLSVRTTSSEDMIALPNIGWVCDNNQDALNEMLLSVSDEEFLEAKRESMKEYKMNNHLAIMQFNELLETTI